MMEKILQFLRSIFSIFTAASRKPTEEHEGLPEIETEAPQDASEIPASETVQVYDEEDIQAQEDFDVLIEEESEPPVPTTTTPTTTTTTEPEIEIPTPSTPDSTTTEIPTDPVVIDDPVIPVEVPSSGTTDVPFPDPAPAPGTPTGQSETEGTSQAGTPEATVPAPPVVVEEPPKPQHVARYMWCLDNGHGSLTPGKRSPVLPDGRQLMEYEFNRDIVGRIILKLKALGIQYYNVVPEVDVDNFLEGRVYRANIYKSDLPKLFLSIHANAAPAPPGKWCAPSISGIETWFYKGNSQGKMLAAVFQKHLIAATGWKNRHIKTQPGRQFYVLRNTGMTAILTENGFYNNKEQCLDLLKTEVREKIAQAHVDAILEIENSSV